MTRKNEKTTPEDNQAQGGMGQNVHNRPPQTCRHSDPAMDEGLGKKFHNPTDAERYAWMAEVGVHEGPFMARLLQWDRGLDELVDQCMAEYEAQRERDAERYAWLRSGGFFHHVTGVIAGTSATGDEFDALVDRGMAEEEEAAKAAVQLPDIRIDDIDPGPMAEGYRDGYNGRPAATDGSKSYQYGYRRGTADAAALKDDEV